MMHHEQLGKDFEDAPNASEGWPDLVAFTGLRGTGKSTAAEMLVEHHGYTRFSFADGVREIASEWFGVPVEEFRDRDLKNEAPEGFELTRREMLRKIGMFYREHVMADYWVKVTSLFVEEADGPVVIDDARFRNEVEWLRSLGAPVIGLRRPGCWNDDDHPSEAEMRENWEWMTDAVVHNDASLDALHGDVGLVLEQFKR